MPSSRARASFSSELALPITVAPASRASWTAAEPMPLPTELIITVSPICSRPRVKSMCHAVPNAICSAAGRLVAELVRDAHELPCRAGEPLGVAARGGEADEPGRRAERLAAGAAEPALAARVHQAAASRGRRPASPRRRRRARRSGRRPRRRARTAGSTGKRETPSRTSTSRWLSALAVMSISTWPGPGSGSGELLQPQHVDTAELVEHDRFHALDLPESARRLRLAFMSDFGALSS